MLTELVNMSINASWLILIVLALRFLPIIPKWIRSVLWALVGVRLLCPFAMESALSLLPRSVSVELEAARMPSPAPSFGSGVSPVVSGSVIPSESYAVPVPSGAAAAVAVGSASAGIDWAAVATAVWLVGFAALVVYGAVSWLRLRGRVGASLHLRDRLYICDDIDSPFILGIAKPRIYLPSSLDERQTEYVVAHETAHLARRDHLWKPLGFVILALHWFNPLCWLAYILLCRDIELACDERVIRSTDPRERAAYSNALLCCSVPHRSIAACPLAFGEIGVKERIKAVLSYKKPAFWVIAAALVCCVVIGVCFLTDPKPTPKYSSYAETGVSLSDLSESECLEFIAEKGIAIPDALAGSDDGSLVRDAILCAEKQPYSPRALDYTTALLFSEEIRLAVNKYYGVNGSPYYQSDGMGGIIFTDVIAEAPFGKEYKVGEILYDAPQYNFAYTVETAPRFALSSLGRLTAKENAPKGLWPEAGVFEETALDENSFDKYFANNGFDIGWHSGDAASIRRDNEKAWRLIVPEDENGLFYYLLRQRDGTVYLAYGYYDPEGDNGADSSGSTIRWLFRLTADYAEAPVTKKSYTTYRLLYMNPLSSYLPGNGDNGYRYIVDENSFTIEHRAGEQPKKTYEVDWKWQDFPWTDEEWAALFKFGDYSAKPNEQYDKLLCIPVSKGLYLLDMDGWYWLAETRDSGTADEYMWSIYLLASEGSVFWNYQPHISAAIPAFRFAFSVPYTRIDAICSDGRLLGCDDRDDTGWPDGTALSYPSGSALYWSPQRGDEYSDDYARSSIIDFTVYLGNNAVYNGSITIYTTASGSYCAYLSKGEGLSLNRDGYDWLGGDGAVISGIAKSWPPSLSSIDGSYVMVETVYDGYDTQFYPRAVLQSASLWTDNGWLAADGVNIANELPRVSDDLRSVLYSDSLKITPTPGVLITSVNVYNDAYALHGSGDTADILKSLPAGDYFVSVNVFCSGDYIAEGGDSEYTTYACLFRLRVE